MNTANRNTVWAGLLAAELAQQGLQTVIIAPGSRSTPLAVAFAETPGIQTYVLSDERSAAYFALGVARASNKPAALLCTSGTAAANFMPAVVEANYAEVPLIVLTADRPTELRESGANQTIDQVKLFGSHVRWFTEVPAPEANPSPTLLRAVRAFAARAWQASQMPLPGPVHLNLPFRKPLEPVPVAADHPAWLGTPALAALENAGPLVTFSRPHLTPAPETVEKLARLLAHPNGLIICGPRCPGDGFAAEVTGLANRLGWPILADSLSGVRFGPHITHPNPVLGGYDTFLQTAADALPRPQVILRFGDLPTSTVLGEYLNMLEDVPQIAISETGRWRDDHFRLTQLIWADPLLLCQALNERIAINPQKDFRQAWQAAENAVWQTLQAYASLSDFEGGILPQVIEALPAGGALYVANSLPVRHLDQFAAPHNKSLRVLGNRGASGIDGTLSSALGAATHWPGLVFVTGDLSFYHDMNGLLAFRRAAIQAVIVVINNDGGGIFHRLPITRFEPPFEEMFIAPHGLTFAGAAQMYGLDYVRIPRAGLPAALSAALAAKRPAIIEIPSDAAAFERLRKAFLQNTANQIQPLKRTP